MPVDLFKRIVINDIGGDSPGGTLSEPSGSVDALISRMEDVPGTKDVRTIDELIPGSANAVDTNDRPVPFAFNAQTADATIGSITQPIDDLYIGRGTTQPR